MGTRTATGRINAVVSADISNQLDADETATGVATIGANLANNYTTGTSADQIDRGWSDKGRSLASTASETIDVFDFAGIDVGSGAGNDALGQAMALAEITGIFIENDAGSSGNLVVGNDGTSAEWDSLIGNNGTIILKPGEFFLAGAAADPAWAVVDTSNHLLKFEAPSGAVTYHIHAILGRSS